MKKAELRRQVQKIIELKALGWSNQEIRAELQLKPRAFHRRIERIRENFRDDAYDLCIESVHRMLDIRKKLLEEYEFARKNEKLIYARMGILRNISEIDRDVPKVCEMLGLTAPNKKGGTLNDPTLEQMSQDDLNREYESRKLEQWN